VGILGALLSLYFATKLFYFGFIDFIELMFFFDPFIINFYWLLILEAPLNYLNLLSVIVGFFGSKSKALN